MIYIIVHVPCVDIDIENRKQALTCLAPAFAQNTESKPSPQSTVTTTCIFLRNISVVPIGI